MKILRPKYDCVAEPSIPFFYLIGPVLGGGDWQHTMCALLGLSLGECTIAIPCRWNDNHRLAQHFFGTPGTYERQTDWEAKYIEQALATEKGCVVAWLEEESQSNPRLDGQPYGRDSYGEMGYFRGLLKYNRGLPIVIGASPNFPGLSTMERNYKNTLKYDFPFYGTMDEVVRAVHKKLE